MKVTWLGQAGFLLEKNGKKILLDPYLSNACGELNPASYRRTPLDESYLALKPDAILLTHDHIDHYDPETAPVFFKKSKKRMSVLGPISVRKKALGDLCGQNCILFNRHTSVSLGGFVFTAVKAAHSDPDAVGVVIEHTAQAEGGGFEGVELGRQQIFG